ncbi:DNA-binding transcriptional regulator, LysR family [Aliiroseovarius halocynthiae]|uniref:LysR family transcriptional regulator n=1 Tax=Aliiroseovarius halocynthiae TaxID=985055 RepID=A0A545SP43_9RHOB|nr:LysR family transcriptional regulator [Aliiroseovarius halocynthiae]TQV66753.1 LysR family transcriptional regulator [Aliiroseovarius halocynthiae]SMR82422.1 DNA-binding transcriptional regulator, LysR family [Aliiroseovarius halocynthiae]
MDWSHLKVALAIARAGTLTRASHMLDMDQTTVGRRLTALEGQLGTILFARSKSGFIPTDQGRTVIEHARRIEIQLGQMTDILQDQAEAAVGVVRLISNSWVLQHLAKRALKEFLEIHPRLELRLSGRLPPVPPHGESTISLWFDAPASALEFATPFCRIPYASYSAVGAPAGGTDWVLFRDDDAPGPTMTRQLQKRLGPDARVAMTATDAAVLRECVVGGIGNGLLPECLAEADPLLKRLRGATPNITLDRVLHMHLNPDTLQSRRVKVVIDWLRQVMVRDFGAELIQQAAK